MGLQGKLVLSFMAVLSVALGASCLMFSRHNLKRLEEATGRQAQQLSMALALGAEPHVREGRIELLRNAANELVKGRDVLFVAFLDHQATALAFASRDPDFYLQRTAFVNTDPTQLMQVHRRRSAGFGSYVEVVAPMVHASAGEDPPRPIIGYVAVGLSQAEEEAELRHTMLLIVGIGCVIVILSLPLAYLMVHQMFTPIRELVRVTRKITSGDLDARVAIRRSDVIGELARSFNEMVIWVKKQQDEVAAANQKLADANRDLEDKVAARTAQVETAMARLESEIAEKEDFLRAVSHDLNAPLRNISGMANMLLTKYKDKFDEDVLHRLERIKKNVDVETDLIAELLELSRIKTRRQKMEPVDVEALIWELRGVFEDDLRSRSIQLILDTSLPVLDAERARVRQIFQNLIDNAIKYMGDGPTREIHVGCKLRMTEAEFYVRDTGMGIDPEDVDKVFFVFRRGKGSAVQNIAGKGVGLASVKSIVETYSGTIWVQSKVGAGTTFHFTINGKHVPATAEYERPAPQSSAPQSSAPAPDPPASEPARPQEQEEMHHAIVR